MRARFRVHLPFRIYLPAEYEGKTISLARRGYDIHISQPYQSVGFDVLTPDVLVVPDVERLSHLLSPSPSPGVSDLARDTVRLIPTDCLELVFLDGDIQRLREGGSVADIRPKIDLCIDVANEYLDYLRVVNGVHLIGHVSLLNLSLLEFVNDRNELWEPEDGFFRRYSAGVAKLDLHIIDDAVLAIVPADLLPAQPRWATLLLDAFALLPEVGPAIVLAFTALESLTAEVLDVAAPEVIPNKLWRWINERDGKLHFQPSVSEQLDTLLLTFCGKSLKDDSDLWTAFRHLRDARNSFVHTGAARIGKGATAELLSAAKAEKLLVDIGRVVAWLEVFLPEQYRRHLVPWTHHDFSWTVTTPQPARES
jgi:hypothetical protein